MTTPSRPGLNYVFCIGSFYQIIIHKLLQAGNHIVPVGPTINNNQHLHPSSRVPGHRSKYLASFLLHILVTEAVIIRPQPGMRQGWCVVCTSAGSRMRQGNAKILIQNTTFYVNRICQAETEIIGVLTQEWLFVCKDRKWELIGCLLSHRPGKHNYLKV